MSTDRVYTVVRRNGEVYLEGASHCPGCEQRTQMSATPPQIPGSELWSCRCVACGAIWTARIVERWEAPVTEL